MSTRAGIFMSTAVAALFLAGCASEPERPIAELTRARTLLDQAEQSGAQRHAGADLDKARTKLAQADDLADEGETESARRLAIEAALDAELATAKANSGEAQRAAQEVRSSVETLRHEAERGVSSSTLESTPPPASSTPIQQLPPAQ